MHLRCSTVCICRSCKHMTALHPGPYCCTCVHIQMLTLHFCQTLAVIHFQTRMTSLSTCSQNGIALTTVARLDTSVEISPTPVTDRRGLQAFVNIWLFLQMMGRSGPGDSHSTGALVTPLQPMLPRQVSFYLSGLVSPVVPVQSLDNTCDDVKGCCPCLCPCAHGC